MLTLRFLQAKASEATARRLGKLPSKYQATSETDSEDEREERMKRAADNARPKEKKANNAWPREMQAKYPWPRPPFPFADKERDEMTPEELLEDNAKRDAYVDAMGFPELRPVSAEALAWDASDEVLLAEMTSLIEDDIQASKVMQQILLHRRELGMDGGVQENPYFQPMVEKFASVGINFDPYNPEAIHPMPGFWEEECGEEGGDEDGHGQEEKGSKSG